MRTLITILSLVLVAATALAAPVAAQTAAELALPGDHQYERYDPSAATYGKVNASQVPTLIQQKAWVYDRTAKDWVYRPAHGLNPMYSSSASAAAHAAGGWQRVHGQVQSIQGNTMRFRADDGRVLSVDLGAVSAGIRKELTRGEGATVIGHPATGAHQIRAQYVQQDSSDPTHHGRIAGPGPSASPGRERDRGRERADQKGDRFAGEVTYVESGQLTMRTDDNRTLYVNTSELPAAVRSSLKLGQHLTVFGTYNSDQNTLVAHHVDGRR
jgi:hypothetical protein